MHKWAGKVFDTKEDCAFGEDVLLEIPKDHLAR